MPGQPFSKIRSNGNYAFGTDLLGSRPDLMTLVGIAIAGWSVAQAHLGNTFAALLGAKHPVTMSIYAAFDSFMVQRQILVTAANELLPKRYAAIFRATLKIIEKAAKDRNRLAHWIWGVSVDPEISTKVLLLANPRHVWATRVKAIRHVKRSKMDIHRAHLTQPRLDPREIEAWTKDDLVRTCRQMEQAWRLANALDQLVDAEPARRRQIYRQLLDVPEIRAVHDREQRPKSKRRKVPPKSPRTPKKV